MAKQTDHAHPAHTIDVRVRYCECDPMGYAHHGEFAKWLEMARIELLREAGIDYGEVERGGVFVVVIALSIRYRRPVRYDDQIAVTVTLDDTSAAKINHSYRIERDGMLLATAETTLACVDREGRPMRVPDYLRIDE